MERVCLDYTLPSNPPDDDFLKMLERSIEADKGIRKITVMPNWSVDYLLPMQGVMVEFDANAKFRPDLFFQDMFAASSLTRVEGIDEQTMEECQEAVRKAVPTHANAPALFLDSDTKHWGASIGDRNCSIGLYSAERLNPRNQMLEKVYMTIAHTSMDPQTYLEMENYFLECEKNQMTYKEVFFNNPILEQFQALLVRNRRRIIFEFAKACNATIRSRKYTKATKPLFIANEEFTTQTNYVKFFENNNKMVFYCDCTCTDDIQHGLIFHRAPLQAPVIYVGPAARVSHVLFSGNKWQNDAHSVFPCGFGKQSKAATFKQFGRIGISQTQLHQKLVVDGEFEDHESLLRHFPYKERTKECRELEKKLGYTFNNLVVVNPHLIRFV
jgi:hypothetical protein